MLPLSNNLIFHLINLPSQSNNLTLPLSVDVIPHLVTFSTWGFTIFLALPGIAAIAYEVRSRKEGKPINASFILRFLGNFVSQKVFTLFSILCICSFGSGLSCLLYYAYSWKGFITISYCVEIIIIIVSILSLIKFLHKSRYIDVSKIEEYTRNI